MMSNCGFCGAVSFLFQNKKFIFLYSYVLRNIIGPGYPRKMRRNCKRSLPQNQERPLFFFKQNLNTFLWSAEDMPGINIEVTSHELNIDPIFKPINQERQKLGPEQTKAFSDEIEKLPDWLANPMVVKIWKMERVHRLH